MLVLVLHESSSLESNKKSHISLFQSPLDYRFHMGDFNAINKDESWLRRREKEAKELIKQWRKEMKKKNQKKKRQKSIVNIWSVE